MARLKTVRDDVEHVWAHQLQAYAKNRSGNFYCDGPTIYSYGRHFPIARHVLDKDKRRCILFTTCGYSKTTTEHINRVGAAIPDTVPVFYIRDPQDTPCPAHLKEYQARIDAIVRKAARSILHGGQLLQRAQELVTEANAFSAAFRLRRRLTFTDDLTTIKARVKKEAAREAAAKKKAMRKHCAEMTTRLRTWANAPEIVYEDGRDYMRVEDDVIRTSRHAQVTVAEAQKVAPIVLGIMDRKETYQRNGERIEVGCYTLDAIDLHAVHVGCHHFSHAEIRRIAKLIGC